ncbi:MAG TPA: hypothetical protein VLA98_11360 [Solirubrobacteraceae bacterium]|nr:hypothetical protein [Solirubrobacteraceae bacterium]
MPSLPSRTERGGDTVVIRLASAADAPALERLARLDSAPRPLRGAILVAESGGELRAARALDDGRAIADPFHPTAGLVALLETRAALLRGAGPTRTRGPGTLRRRLQPRAALR